MATAKPAKGEGTAQSPWQLTTPPGSAAFTAWRDPAAEPPALVVQVGSTQLRYRLRCIEDLHAMLKAHGDWMPLAAPTNRSPRPKAASRPGAALPPTRSKAGTG